MVKVRKWKNDCCLDNLHILSVLLLLGFFFNMCNLVQSNESVEQGVNWRWRAEWQARKMVLVDTFWTDCRGGKVSDKELTEEDLTMGEIVKDWVRVLAEWWGIETIIQHVTEWAFCPPPKVLCSLAFTNFPLEALTSKGHGTMAIEPGMFTHTVGAWDRNRQLQFGASTHELTRSWEGTTENWARTRR